MPCKPPSPGCSSGNLSSNRTFSDVPGLVSVAAIFVLGIGAQWIAWRYRVPSILLLLILGFLAGPVTGLLDPVMLQGEWIFTFVAISVGIILFEGGLSLRLDELREVGGAVIRLITFGVFVTWVLAAVGAYLLLDFNPSMSILLGAILTVTGPTVIIPLLRHVRPKGRVGTVAKWEGITIDPIGAILAVLVLETILLFNEPGPKTFSEAAFHALKGLMLQAVIGLGVGLAGAAVLVLLLRRRLVPDYLQNPAALMVVIGIFAISDSLQHESGLLATTIMGLAVANQRYVVVRRIVEFKEDLRVLLISVLFIILSARLQIGDLRHLGVGAILFLAGLMLIVRPLSVFLSTMGTRLNWKEQTFLAWLAPRGIVAAAVASLFSFRLMEIFPIEAAALVPVVFLVIVGTVAIYGLSASAVARVLGLADPNPQGILFIGAYDWGREVAAAVASQEFSILMVDSNPENVRRAQADGLPAIHANVLSEHITDQLELSGIGRLLALTPNDEVNSLAILHFTQIFDSAEVYQLATREEQRGRTPDEEFAQHLRGRPLFGKATTYVSLSDRFNSGAEVKIFDITDDYTYTDFEEQYGRRSTPLFVKRGPNQLHVFSEEEGFIKPESGHTLIALVDPVSSVSDAVGEESVPESQPS